MKQEERATLTVDKELRDLIKVEAARRKVSIYEYIRMAHERMIDNGRMNK